MMNTNYTMASPANAVTGAQALQGALNSIQNSLVSQYPAGQTVGFPPVARPNYSTQQPAPVATYSPVGNTYYPSTAGTPTWNGSMWVGQGGQPYTGTYQGQTYVGGQSYQQQQNNPSEAYQAVNITKSPQVAAGANSLFNTFGNNLSLANNDFSDFLTAARAATGAATSSFNNDINNAYNIGPLSNTLNRLNTQYGTAANNLNTGFANTSNNLNTQYSDILNNLTGQENADVSQAYGMLPQYNQAISNIGNLESDALQRNVSRYAAASGTPTGLGSNEEQTLALGEGQIRVPLEEAQINKQYDILQNMQLPLEQQQAQARVGQLQNFTLPVAQTQYNQGLNTLNTTYNNQFNTATMLQNLQLQIAGKPISEAVQYMQAMGVPQDIQQALLSGNISNLGALSNVWQGANYQGLQNVFGNSLATPTASAFNAPPIPNFNTNYAMPTPAQMGIPQLPVAASSNTVYPGMTSPGVGYGSGFTAAAGAGGMSPADLASLALLYGVNPNNLSASSAANLATEGVPAFD